MSVLKVEEVFEGRQASEDQDSRSSTRRFIVYLSAATDDPIEARDALGVPLINEEHDKDSNTFVTDKNAEPTGNRTVWFVTVNYSTRGTSDSNDSSGGQNPLEENPSIVWTTRDIEVVVERAQRVRRTTFGDSGGFQDTFDAPGPVRNSAGDLYTDPPLVIPEFLQVVTIKRNERPGIDFNPDRVKVRLNFMNLSPIRVGGVLIGTQAGWLIKYDAGAIQQRSGVDFVNVTYQIILARKGRNWDDLILDQGLNRVGNAAAVITNAPGGKKPIQDKFGKKVTRPVNLDGAGQPLGDTETPIYLRYRTKGELNFSVMNLPRNFSRTGR